MTHTYQLTGMTCTSCEAKVKSLLERVENVTNVDVSKEYNSVTISMDRHIGLSNFQKVLDAKYTISAKQNIEFDRAPNPNMIRRVIGELLIDKGTT